MELLADLKRYWVEVIACVIVFGGLLIFGGLNFSVLAAPIKPHLQPPNTLNPTPGGYFFERGALHCDLFYMNGNPVIGTDQFRSGEFRALCRIK